MNWDILSTLVRMLGFEKFKRCTPKEETEYNNTIFVDIQIRDSTVTMDVVT